MEHHYTDYLFILALYEEGISLDKLLFHIDPSRQTSPDARSQALKTLSEMEGKGLVRIACQNGKLNITLTTLGRQISERVAAILADNMVHSWRAQQGDFPIPAKKVANY